MNRFYWRKFFYSSFTVNKRFNVSSHGKVKSVKCFSNVKKISRDSESQLALGWLAIQNPLALHAFQHQSEMKVPCLTKLNS